ncbi:MAG: hypothetical protein U0528_18015 [Anaerolineae bacterium]
MLIPALVRHSLAALLIRLGLGGTLVGIVIVNLSADRRSPS